MALELSMNIEPELGVGAAAGAITSVPNCANSAAACCNRCARRPSRRPSTPVTGASLPCMAATRQICPGGRQARGPPRPGDEGDVTKKPAADRLSDSERSAFPLLHAPHQRATAGARRRGGGNRCAMSRSRPCGPPNAENPAGGGRYARHSATPFYLTHDVRAGARTVIDGQPMLNFAS